MDPQDRGGCEELAVVVAFRFYQVLGAIGAFDRRPQSTNTDSPRSTKLNGVFPASPREM